MTALRRAAFWGRNSRAWRVAGHQYRGCPIHPGWFVDTILQIAGGTMTPADLDEWERPLAYTASLVHHGCAERIL
jgi:Ni,Fe-hydrogenase I small subunit